MKAVILEGGFGIDRVSVGEFADVAPDKHEVKLRVKAMSLNYRDYAVVKGFYNPAQFMPLVLGSDCVGEIIQVGSAVSRVKVGDRVCPIFAQKWLAGNPSPEMMTHSQLGSPTQGVMSEYVVLSEEGLVRVPDHLTDQEAATLPCAAVTAWQCVSSVAACKPGDTVVIQGTGGVSSFALAFTRMLGARAIVLTSSQERAQQARTDGADLVINYRDRPQWAEQVIEATAGQGAELVVDVVGGAGLSQSIGSVTNGGIVALVGFLEGTRAEVDVRQMLRRRVRLEAISVGSRDMFEEMNRALFASRWKPRQAAVYDVHDIRSALEAQGSGRHTGKIVIQANW